MPVYKILEEMPSAELAQWSLYFQARPIGWREDNRTSMLLNAQGVKASGEDIFPTLQQLKKTEAERPTEEVMQGSLRKSVFGALLENAQK